MRENKGWLAIKLALFGEGRPATEKEMEDYGVKAPENLKPLPKPKDRYYAETDEEIAESKAALADWREREDQAFKRYKPKGPAYRIRQVPSGEYVIERRLLKRPNLSTNSWHSISYFEDFKSRYVLAHLVREKSVAPVEVYETVSNPDAPIVTREYKHSYSLYPSEARVTGYSPLIFNVFADAETYLKRMARTPEEASVGYDFPPLKRRVPAKPKAATARKRVASDAE